MENEVLRVRLGARGAFYSSSLPNASAEEQFPYLLFKPAVKDTIKALLTLLWPGGAQSARGKLKMLYLRKNT